jgi:hypothetical protein
MRRTIKLLSSTSLLLSALCFSQLSLADRCSPEILSKLPESKRAQIEARCAEEAAKPKYTISNKNKIDKEMAPEDNYTGDDRDDLEKMVRKAWQKAHPSDKILGIHFPNAKWKTEKKKRWNDASSSWHYTDTSILLAKVVVKTDDTIATIFPAYINKDNLDDSTNVGVATKTKEYVINQMLIANYK